ncbi:MAG: M16 family metallopeptidase, partial [bacterium]
MFKKVNLSLVIMAIIFLFHQILPHSTASAAARVEVLDNGLELILIENHSNPMVASVVVVKTGSCNETPAINGVSHMLEHLLFNGTANRTQQQLYDEMDFYGGYDNATTGKEFTTYMILMPAEHIDKGLDIQADMLFNSVIPPEKLEKERGIVVEEIGKDRDSPDYLADLFFNRKLYRGTSYALPVLGTPTTITHMSRDQILDYYHRFYVPNNMVALVMGDFETEGMIEKFKQYFGPYPPGELPPPKTDVLSPITGTKIFTKVADTKSIRLSLAFNAPNLEDPDYYAFEVLASIFGPDAVATMLGSQTASRLDKALKGGEKPLVFNVYQEYSVYDVLPTLNIHATLPPYAGKEKVIEMITHEIQRLVTDPVSEEEINSTIVKIKTDKIFLQEKFLYYGMSEASLVAKSGYDFVASYLEKIEKVTPQDVQRVAQKYFSDIAYVATALEPKPEVEESEGQKKAERVKKEVLDNGLTVIIKESHGSRVFAVHLLAKNRCYHEPEGRTGIADFLGRMLLQGTKNRTLEQISAELQSIGARLKVTDSPYIPYDDYYFSPLFSYIRLETIDEFYEQGLTLLADMVKNPALDERGIEKVRAELLGAIKAAEGSTQKTAKNLYYRTIFPEHPLSRPILGLAETVQNISRQDLVEFHRSYFAPNNLILSVVGNVSAEKILDKVKHLFGEMRFNPQVVSTIPGPTEVGQMKEATEEKGKGQSYLYLGNLYLERDEKDIIPLQVMNSMLSTRLAFDLREKQGLAYTIG